jgi:hypothetical protein
VVAEKVASRGLADNPGVAAVPVPNLGDQAMTHSPRGDPMDTYDPDDFPFPGFLPHRSIEELRPARKRLRLTLEEMSGNVGKNIKPIHSLDDLRADTFDTDEELEEFLVFNSAERQRDLI